MKSIAIQKGVTLLEIMLVLAIGSSIIVLGLKYYNSQQKTQQLRQLNYNADTIMQALGQYYNGFCGNTTDGQNSLNPNTNAAINLIQPHPITMSSLQALGFIQPANLINNHPLVDNSGDTIATPYSAYVLQLNPHLTHTENVNVCTSPTVCTTTPITDATNMVVFYWTVQVAIKILTPDSYTDEEKTNMISAYQKILGADCASTTVTNGMNTYVTPCSSAPIAGVNSYVVFERLPSFASAYTTSSLWQSMPLLKQFNLQYTHDQMYELINNNLGLNGAKIYYLCGT